VNKFIKAGITGEHLNFALATATRYGHICVVDRLLSEGADINATKQGNDEKAVAGRGTLLQGAAQSGLLEIFQLILAMGADSNLRAALYHMRNDSRTRTPMEGAAEMGNGIPAMLYLKLGRLWIFSK
jgi:ankyrin repeat protein